MPTGKRKKNRKKRMTKAVYKNKPVASKLRNYNLDSNSSQINTMTGNGYTQLNHEFNKDKMSYKAEKGRKIITVNERVSIDESWFDKPKIKKLHSNSDKAEWLLRNDLYSAKKDRRKKTGGKTLYSSKNTLSFERNDKKYSFKVKDKVDIYFGKSKYVTGKIIKFSKDEGTNTVYAIVEDVNGQRYKVYKGSMYYTDTLSDKIKGGD